MTNYLIFVVLDKNVEGKLMRKTNSNIKIFAVVITIAATLLMGCAKKTETVELTIDNWQDYLEINEIFVPKYNDFGEVDEIEDDYVLTLKDGRTFAKDTKPEVAVEYEYDDGCYELVSADFENIQIEYVEVDESVLERYEIEIDHNKDTTTFKRFKINGEYSENTLGDVEAAAVTLNDGEVEPSISFSFGNRYTIKETNFKITRIAGTIELNK